MRSLIKFHTPGVQNYEALNRCKSVYDGPDSILNSFRNGKMKLLKKLMEFLSRERDQFCNNESSILHFTFCLPSKYSL